MTQVIEEMNLEERINFLFTDANGIGAKYADIDTHISECMNFEFTILSIDHFSAVLVKRDLELNEIVKIMTVSKRSLN